MRRRLLNVVMALSLLLCGAALSAWWRSTRVIDRFDRNGGVADWEIDSANARLFLSRNSFPRVGSTPEGQPLYDVLGTPMERPDPRWHYSRRTLGHDPPLDMWEPSVWKAVGLEWQPYSVSGIRGWWLRLRWSSLALAYAAFPAAYALRQARRAAHRRRSCSLRLCARCGYDLRATPHRCPECGEAAGNNSLLLSPGQQGADS